MNARQRRKKYRNSVKVLRGFADMLHNHVDMWETDSTKAEIIKEIRELIEGVKLL